MTHISVRVSYIKPIFKKVYNAISQFNIFTTLIIIFLICTDSILISIILPISTSLKEGLIASIVGSGVIAGVVSIAILHLQEYSIYTIQKRQSEKFFSIKLIPSLNEIFDRAKSLWNLSGQKKTYFDSSYANSLFDLFEVNFDNITTYQTYFPDNIIVNTLVSVYREIRHGYVIGEKVDQELNQIIRRENHIRNIEQYNDFDTMKFIKGKIIGLSDNTLLQTIGLSSKPQSFDEIYHIVHGTNIFTTWLLEIKSIRDTLETKISFIQAEVSRV